MSTRNKVRIKLENRVQKFAPSLYFGLAKLTNQDSHNSDMKFLFALICFY